MELLHKMGKDCFKLKKKKFYAKIYAAKAWILLLVFLFPFLSDFQSLPLLEYFMTDQLILCRPLELLSLDSIASLLTPSENL